MEQQKNKFPKHYKQILNLGETLEGISVIEEILVSFFKVEYKLIPLKQPLFSSTTTCSNFFELNNSRQITFDTSNDFDSYFQYINFEFWIRNQMLKLDLKSGQGVLLKAKWIERDKQISNFTSLEQNKLFVEFKYDDEKDVDSLIQTYFKFTFDTLNKANELLISKFPKLSVFRIPETFKKINWVDIEKKMPYIDFNELVLELANKHVVFAKKSIIEKNDKHYIFYELFARAFYTNEAVKLFSVSQRINQEDLDNFKKESKEIHPFLNEAFAKEQLKNNFEKTISVEINLDVCIMFILGKLHILEIQSNLNSKEIQNLIDSKKISNL